MAFSNNSMADELKKEEVAQPAGVDYEAMYKAQVERAKTAEENARNLRKGYEKYKAIAKGGTAADGEEPTVSELVQQEVQRAMADSQVEKENAALTALALQQARELKEAKLALAAKGSITGAGTGAGEGTMQSPANEYLSNDQLAELKKKGFSPEKIAKVVENMKRLKG